MLKKIFAISLILMVVLCCFACKKEQNFEASPVAPNTDKLQNDYNLDFVEMHNNVINSLTTQYTPFFFVKNGEFDISGDNEKKVIKITCTCMDGTTVEDVDLFLCMVLQYVGANAAEQDFRFATPTIDSTGTFLDFGSVFKTYSLALRCDTESGKVLRNDDIKAGEKIPVDSRYWKE